MICVLCDLLMSFMLVLKQFTKLGGKIVIAQINTYGITLKS